MNSICCRGVKVDYNGNEVISDLNLEVSSGTWTTVIGPNGAGKSSLMHAILGLVPSKGSIEISGHEVTELSLPNLAKNVAFVPQEPVIPNGMKVFDYVLLGRIHNLGFFAAESPLDIDIAEDILKKLDAHHLIGRTVETLSGGERQRIVLARALTQKSPILILDEPTTALDISHQHEFLNLIDEFCINENLTVLAVMHDLTSAGRYGDRVALLSKGRIEVEGVAEEVITSEIINKYFNAKVRVVNDEGGPVVVPATNAHMRRRNNEK